MFVDGYMSIDKSARKFIPLNQFLTEYSDRNANNEYKPVAVGRYGIRTRESIYSKELAKDYSKNKLIYKNTLTVGMGSVQIDIGVLTDDITYSVSPAYHTYKIENIDSAYLRYCLQCRNQDMFTQYVKRGSRQGKTIDLKRWLTYEIPVYDNKTQLFIVKALEKQLNVISLMKQQLEKLDLLVKARFVEMFGDVIANDKNWETKPLESVCYKIYGGGTPSKSHPEYYENGDIPWVSSKDMKNSIITDSKIHINELGVKNSTAKLVPANSVIMVIRSGILKHTLPIAINAIPITVNQDLKVLIPNDLVLSIFLANQIKMLEKDILSGVRAVTADNIEFNSLKQRNIIVPPLSLQTQFADFVKQVDKSRFVVQKELDKAQMLFDSLMQEYFG